MRRRSAGVFAVIALGLLGGSCSHDDRAPLPTDSGPQPVSRFQGTRPEWRQPHIPHIAIEIPPEGCDLRLCSLSARQVLFNGVPYVEFNWMLTNVGRESADIDGETDGDGDNLSMTAYLSKDPVYSPGSDLAAGGAVLMAPPRLSMIDPGAARCGSFKARLKASIVDYPYLVLRADTGNGVVESNEGNNDAAVSIAW